MNLKSQLSEALGKLEEISFTQPANIEINKSPPQTKAIPNFKNSEPSEEISQSDKHSTNNFYLQEEKSSSYPCSHLRFDSNPSEDIEIEEGLLMKLRMPSAEQSLYINEVIFILFSYYFLLSLID